MRLHFRHCRSRTTEYHYPLQGNKVFVAVIVIVGLNSVNRLLCSHTVWVIAHLNGFVGSVDFLENSSVLPFKTHSVTVWKRIAVCIVWNITAVNLLFYFIDTMMLIITSKYISIIVKFYCDLIDRANNHKIFWLIIWRTMTLPCILSAYGASTSTALSLF